MASNPSDSFVQTAPTVRPVPKPPRPATAAASPSVKPVLACPVTSVVSTSVNKAPLLDGALTQDLAGAQDVMSADYAQIGGGLRLRNSSNDNFIGGH